MSASIRIAPSRAAPLRLDGSVVALATPFRESAVDTDALVRLCRRQVDAGTAALLACGSTGEAAAMRADEQAAVLYAVVEAAEAVPVIAGCGGCSTEMAMELAVAAARQGVAALLCAPPAYVRPTQEGIIAHVRAISHAAGLPVLLYDVPGRTGVAVHDETVARLFERDLIVGLKDATADLGRPARLRARCGPELLQLSGDDATAAAYRAMGGHGCVSVVANLVPRLCAQLHRAWEAGELATFARTRDLLAPLAEALFAESNPIPLKAALVMLDLASGEMRLPLTRAGRGTCNRLAELLVGLMAAEEALAPRSRYALVG